MFLKSCGLSLRYLTNKKNLMKQEKDDFLCLHSVKPSSIKRFQRLQAWLLGNLSSATKARQSHLTASDFWPSQPSKDPAYVDRGGRILRKMRFLNWDTANTCLRLAGTEQWGQDGTGDGRISYVVWLKKLIPFVSAGHFKMMLRSVVVDQLSGQFAYQWPRN